MLVEILDATESMKTYQGEGMEKFIIILFMIACIIMFSIPLNMSFAEEIETLEERYNSYDKSQEAYKSTGMKLKRYKEYWEDYGDYIKEYVEVEKTPETMDELWGVHVNQTETRWNQYVSEIENVWGTFHGSTNEEVVKYSEDKTAKTYINLEDGYAVFEIVIDAKQKENPELIQANLKKIIEKTINEEDAEGHMILKDQLEISEIQPIHRGYIIGKDGEKRYKYGIVSELVSDHLLKRAKLYIDDIRFNCKKYDLDIALVMAIIETESHFYPSRVSHANAVGLMQIVPKWAGLETNMFIYNENVKPTVKYLKNPNRNIQHGCCYLSLLYNRHWMEAPEGKKKDFVVVCSYNCGPHNVNKMVFKHKGYQEVWDENKMYQMLRERTPEETSDYLAKVTKRREKWVNTLKSKRL